MLDGCGRVWKTMSSSDDWGTPNVMEWILASCPLRTHHSTLKRKSKTMFLVL